MIIILIYLAAFFILELAYFRVADKFNIIDKPNQRSSHTQITLRGGGVIFPLAVIVFGLIYKEYEYMCAGAFLISFVSFYDDIKGAPNKVRIAIHLISVFLLFYQVDLLSLNLLWIIPAFVLTIGIINAYNFMDGINGITAAYTLVTLTTLYVINTTVIFADRTLIEMLLVASIVFAFFNFRKKAKCFAGDVGSVSIAYLICFFLLSLMIKTSSLYWILLLGVYGLDAVATIALRIIRRENIFIAHRSHFYQFLSNELRISHLLVAILYMLVQLIVNMFLLFVGTEWTLTLFATIIIAYIILRLKLEGSDRLFKIYQRS
jgi:UDP-GlcNAc:undecaprenyl-phosphate/decaprenyl-phosphate GlcNAc-1-phosphate transferase